MIQQIPKCPKCSVSMFFKTEVKEPTDKQKEKDITLLKNYFQYYWCSKCNYKTKKLKSTLHTTNELKRGSSAEF